MNKILKWLKDNNVEVIAQGDMVVIFKLNNIKYKFTPSYTGKRISYLEIYRLESQQDESLPNIKTLVVSNKNQQGLIREFQEYLSLKL